MQPGCQCERGAAEEDLPSNDGTDKAYRAFSMKVTSAEHVLGNGQTVSKESTPAPTIQAGTKKSKPTPYARAEKANLPLRPELVVTEYVLLTTRPSPFKAGP